MVCKADINNITDELVSFSVFSKQEVSRFLAIVFPEMGKLPPRLRLKHVVALFLFYFRNSVWHVYLQKLYFVLKAVCVVTVHLTFMKHTLTLYCIVTESQVRDSICWWMKEFCDRNPLWWMSSVQIQHSTPLSVAKKEDCFMRARGQISSKTTKTC